ncbi:hypothetical protein D3C81_1432440 [compost metagenome]
MAVQAFGQIGVEIEATGGVADVPQCLGQRFAVVANLQLSQFLLPFADALCDAAQDCGPC